MIVAELSKCWWLIDPRSGERACNSAYACRAGKMLVVTKNRTKALAGGKGSCAVCVDVQAVGVLEFFGELYSLAKGFWPFLREFGKALHWKRIEISCYSRGGSSLVRQGLHEPPFLSATTHPAGESRQR